MRCAATPSLGFALPLYLLLSCLTAPVAAQSATALELLVREAGTGAPLRDATVWVSSAGRFTLTDATGHALILDLSEGEQVVEIRHPGHATRQLNVMLEQGLMTQLQVVLEVQPIELEGVEVTGVSRVPRLVRSGFYYRMKTNGFGTFLEPEDIERAKRGTGRLSDLLRGTRGLTIEYEDGAPVLYGSRGPDSIQMGRCKPDVFLDGVLVQTSASERILRPLENIDYLISLQDISAIEVYPSGITTPPEFGMGRACAAVAIWTHVG